ncbi:hypothetical protein BC629DRAFT_447479 [Irpex lacteus]|nr:hypothetical protein BC629DRAFT_447479 [Irpex lacteus]
MDIRKPDRRYAKSPHLVHEIALAHTILIAYHRIDSTNLLPAMQIDLALKQLDTTEDEQMELEDMMHNLDIRSIQSVKRMSMHAAHGAFAIQDQTLQTIEKVVDLLTDLSPMFQVCKIAIALVRVAQQTVQAMQEIDASIDSMWKSIHEVAIKSLACSGENPIPGTKGACRRVIDLAARSAEIVDRWVDSSKHQLHSPPLGLTSK